MSTLTVTSLESINFAPSSTKEEIAQNISCIISTPLYSCPLHREFGTDMSALDRPIPEAQMLFRVAIIEAIEKWEPRVKVKSINYTDDPEGAMDGKLTPVVTVEILED